MTPCSFHIYPLSLHDALPICESHNTNVLGVGGTYRLQQVCRTTAGGDQYQNVAGLAQCTNLFCVNVVGAGVGGYCALADVIGPQIERGKARALLLKAVE